AAGPQPGALCQQAQGSVAFALLSQGKARQGGGLPGAEDHLATPDGDGAPEVSVELSQPRSYFQQFDPQRVIRARLQNCQDAIGFLDDDTHVGRWARTREGEQSIPGGAVVVVEDQISFPGNIRDGVPAEQPGRTGDLAGKITGRGSAERVEERGTQPQRAN